MQRLLEHWTQYMELQHPDVAIDISRLEIWHATWGNPGTAALVGSLPAQKEIKTEHGSQDMMCFEVQRLPPASSTTSLGLAEDLRQLKFGATCTINITVTTMASKTFGLKISRAATVMDLKSFIQDHEGIPLYQQRLIADGQEMRNNHLPVGFYIMDTASEAKITLVLRLKGC